IEGDGRSVATARPGRELREVEVGGGPERDLHAVDTGAAHPAEVLVLVPGPQWIGWRGERLRRMAVLELAEGLGHADWDLLTEVVGDQEERGRAYVESLRHRRRLRAIPRDDRGHAAVLLPEPAHGDAARRVPGEPDVAPVELGPARVHLAGMRRRAGARQEVVEGGLRVRIVEVRLRVV